MIYILIGHRGSGKSHLARRMPDYFRAAGQELRVEDLDEVIERGENCTISEIFEKDGEAAFRLLEQKYLQKLCTEFLGEYRSVVIVLGAGFEGSLPTPGVNNALCLWVRRPTDQSGRIFLNRPRLNPDQSPLNEFISRLHEREPRYSRFAHEELMISEGFEHPNPAEMGFLLNTLNAKGGILTLSSKNFEQHSESDRKRFLERRVNWGLRLEVRDDLLTPEQIRFSLQTIPHSQILLSLRQNKDAPVFLSSLKENALWDWPAEWPLAPGLCPPVMSLHHRECHESVMDAGRNLEKASRGLAPHLKLAVEVQSFGELWEGHLWAQEDPQHRTFLPRSSDGRWSWYRLLMKNPTKLNFIREGEGSAPDQPYLLDWVRAPEFPKSFAAVLGHPVSHSRTPAEHFGFFSKRKMTVVAIPIQEAEWEGALDILCRIGLRAAAVTAPLKIKASHSSQQKSQNAQRFDSVNTLIWSEKDQQWIGENTDLMGLNALFHLQDRHKKIAVWGGGGTLPLLEEVLPSATFYSARTSKAREMVSPEFSPEIVVWGVGRSRYSHENSAQWPDPSWKPNLIIDLNYSEDSPGREYALKTGAKYRSGIEMFRTQAQGQREFWEKLGL